MSIVRVWRDNLNSGIYLTQYGPQTLEIVLQSIGYNPGAPDRSGNHDHYHSRSRRAIDTGAQKYTEREPGWFFIGAFQFAGIFYYRAIWYVSRYGQCFPLALDPFVRSLKDRRVKDTATRLARTRAPVAADSLFRIRKAMVSGDQNQFDAIIKELTQDETYGPIMEIVTGHYGVEHVELMPFVQFLIEQTEFDPHRFGLGKALRDLRKSRNLRERAKDSVSLTLAKLVMLRAGSRNPKPQALSEARDVLAGLPAP